MDAGTALRLLSLNKQFYQTFASEFSATRRRIQPGVRRILECLRGDENQLDLGCGNGELARQRLKMGHSGSYTGVDFSTSLLAAARLGTSLSVTLVQADLTADEWESELPGAPRSLFDLVTAFAVLHHLPGASLRAALLDKVRRLLLPGGRFIHSEWQFLNSPRLKSRLQPWSQVGLRPEEVDPGDHLLDWRSGGHGLRYVHHFDCGELVPMAAAAGFTITSQFMSDGGEGNLSLYQVWEKT
jgi:tRNA (uracil-5-)-methyltransferase TRM9